MYVLKNRSLKIPKSLQVYTFVPEHPSDKEQKKLDNHIVFPLPFKLPLSPYNFEEKEQKEEKEERSGVGEKRKRKVEKEDERQRKKPRKEATDEKKDRPWVWDLQYTKADCKGQTCES